MGYSGVRLAVLLTLLATLPGVAAAQRGTACRDLTWRAESADEELSLDSVPEGDLRDAVRAARDHHLRVLPTDADHPAPEWAPDAVGLPLARRARPEPHDLLQPETVAANRRAHLARAAIFEDEWSAVRTDLLCASATIEGDDASVRAHLIVRSSSPIETIEEGIDVRLRRVAGRFLVHSMRRWAVDNWFFDDYLAYDARFWRARDAAARRAPSPTTLDRARHRLDALDRAHHYPAAFEAGVALCARDDATANDCWAAEQLAWIVGRTDDAQRLAGRALERVQFHARFYDRTDPCPRGTALDRADTTPDGPGITCRRPDGTREGPGVLLHPGGAPRALGRYDDGHRVGFWIELDPEGRVTGRR